MFAANRFLMTSEPVDRTAHAKWATIEHMRVHHRRAQVRVTEQLLHHSNVVAVLEQMGRKRMPESVRTHTFGNACLPRRVRHRFLDDRFVNVEPGRWSPFRIGAYARGRKDELPGPLRRCVRVLAVERERQDNAPESSREIRLMLPRSF